MVKDMPLAPLERILKKAGAKRVSKSALVEFAQVIISYAHDLSAEASALAEHTGRKTIIGSDVRLAKKKLS
jgi:histone H3/H4